jgi:tRNA threonylcarbamoyladenosine biosynthesis protein TsaB
MKTLAATGKVVLAPPHLRWQHAAGVAMAAQNALNRGETVTDAQLEPFYLRPPQAERELALKKERKL